MARSHARIWLSVWADRDFLALPMHAQWLYFALASQENINHAGVIALSAKRWATLCADRDPKLVDDALDVLVRSRFVVIDRDTEQLLVRSFIRSDQVDRQPNTLKNACTSILLVTSPPIRTALLAELQRLDQARIGALRVPVGHEPVLFVLRATIAALAADDTPPDGTPVTPSEGYDCDPFNTDPIPRRRAGEGAGEGVGEAPVSCLVNGHLGGEAPPRGPRRGSRDPGPGQRPLMAAAPDPVTVELPPIPDRCEQCSRLGLAPDDPGPRCKACQHLRERREQQAANAAGAAARAEAEQRAAQTAARAACCRCDTEGWLLEHPAGPPVEPARRCGHLAEAVPPADPKERPA
jgi:hypothetical protein